MPPSRYEEAMSDIKEVSSLLQGINNQSDMYAAYNRIQSRRVFDEGSLTSLNRQGENPDVAKETPAKVEPSNMDLRLDSIKPRTNLSIEDISLSLKEPASFSMKGKDSDIESLDIQKAVSDMQKDQALMQYQYFVGEQTPYMSSDDGVVIAK